MYVLYSLILTLAFLALLPYFAYKAFVSRKYLTNLGERLGRLPTHLVKDSQRSIWIHAVSVGEALAAVPLLDALKARYPDHQLIVSTTTDTGQAVARARLRSADGFCYFPFDWKFSVSRALDVIKPDIVILMESELWPNFLRICRQCRIPVVVANGRISDRSFRRSLRVVSLVRRLYRQVSHFAMQSEVDAERARALGAVPANVSVSGNLKFDADLGPFRGAAPPIGGLTQFLTRSASPLIIAGSTAEGEEEILIAAFKLLLNESRVDHPRLLIAPRHPERFDTVAHLLSSSGLEWVRRSDLPAADSNGHPTTLTTAADAPSGAQVILLDSIGELSATFSLASVVFIGGSLVPRGGHNILEPALSARPIVVGPHMENFREITRSFLEASALIQLPSAAADEHAVNLNEALLQVLTDAKHAQETGGNALRAVEESRGATTRTMAIIESILEPAGK